MLLTRAGSNGILVVAAKLLKNLGKLILDTRNTANNLSQLN